MSKPTVSRLALLIFLSALTLIELARASMNNYGEYLAEHILSFTKFSARIFKHDFLQQQKGHDKEAAAR